MIISLYTSEGKTVILGSKKTFFLLKNKMLTGSHEKIINWHCSAGIFLKTLCLFVQLETL
jgi:hypothetical protein